MHAFDIPAVQHSAMSEVGLQCGGSGPYSNDTAIVCYNHSRNKLGHLNLCCHKNINHFRFRFMFFQPDWNRCFGIFIGTGHTTYGKWPATQSMGHHSQTTLMIGLFTWKNSFHVENHRTKLKTQLFDTGFGVYNAYHNEHIGLHGSNHK
jgi:hypothetical protein